MTSKQRFLKILNGVIPDRVPISTYELCGYIQNSLRTPSRLIEPHGLHT